MGYWVQEGIGYGNELNYPGYLGQCAVGRVSYLGRVKQGNYHTHVLYTIPNPNYTLHKPYPFIITYHNNLPYPPRYFGHPDWESVTLCKYQHFPILDTCLSFHSDTLSEHLPYPTNRRKSTPPYTEYLPHLPHSRHLSLHTCTHLTLPFIIYPTDDKCHFAISWARFGNPAV